MGAVQRYESGSEHKKRNIPLDKEGRVKYTTIDLFIYEDLGIVEEGMMQGLISISGIVFVSMLFALSACSVQDEKPAAPAAPAAKAEAKAPAEKAPEKAKAEKARGDVGLLDLEKNYMILVTKEGKLVTLDFDQKTKAVQITPTPAKIGDVGLGSSATVTYAKEKDKNVASSVEFKAAKGGD
jgi:hypothetical protein